MKPIRHRPLRPLGLLLALMAMASSVPGLALAAPAEPAPGAPRPAAIPPAPSPAEAKAIAEEAWLYAYAPLQERP